MTVFVRVGRRRRCCAWRMRAHGATRRIGRRTRVQPTPMYLGRRWNTGRNRAGRCTASGSYALPALGRHHHGAAGLGSTTPWAMPIDQRLDEAYSVLFTTRAVRRADGIARRPEVVLHIASTAEVAYFHVKLCDVAPDGASRLICDGGLLATHRNSHEAPGSWCRADICTAHSAEALRLCDRSRPPAARRDRQRRVPERLADRAAGTQYAPFRRPARVAHRAAGCADGDAIRCRRRIRCLAASASAGGYAGAA